MKNNRSASKTRNIFLDTEVLRPYGHDLNAETMKILGGYVADGIFVLHTTDVALREVGREIVAIFKEAARSFLTLSPSSRSRTGAPTHRDASTRVQGRGVPSS